MINKTGDKLWGPKDLRIFIETRNTEDIEESIILEESNRLKIMNKSFLLNMEARKQNGIKYKITTSIRHASENRYSIVIVDGDGLDWNLSVQ